MRSATKNIQAVEFNPIEIDVNQYIAILIDMESYYFSILEAMFILTLNETYDSTDKNLNLFKFNLIQKDTRLAVKKC